jgi:photosystem II stability/assembly factor-like uncharacterized protein
MQPSRLFADYDPTQKPTEVTALWASGGKAIFAVGSTENRRALILLTHDQGIIWSKQKIEGKPTMLYGIWGSSILNAFSVGAGGVILHTKNGGASWEQQKSTITENLFGIWGSAKQVFAVGNNGTILSSSDSGKTWSPQKSGSAVALYGIWGASTKDIFTVGRSGTILHTTDLGKTWSLQKSGTKETLRAIFGTTSAIIAAGDNGTILQSTDNGKTWVSRTTKSTNRLNAIWGNEDSLFIAGDGVLLRSDDKGETWSPQEIPADKPTLVGIWGSAASSSVYAVSSRGAMLSSTDGKTWKYKIEP